MIAQPHPLTGFAVRFEARGDARVGRDSDLERRRHRFAFSGAAVRAAAPPAPQVLLPFVTADQFRTVTSNGHYADRRRGSATLRLPDDIAAGKDLSPGTPLPGLSLHEAETVVDLLGGRIPSEKELDYLLSEHRSLPWRMPLSGAALTSSPWSPFAYSLALYDEVAADWHEPSRPPVSLEQNARAILRWDGTGLSRQQESDAPGEMDELLTPIVFPP
jgi:hypothetical protein